MHYLRIGSPTRAAQLDEYVARAQSGDSWEQAFAAFESDASALERELQEYVRRFSLPQQRVDLGVRIAEPVVPRGRPIETAEVQAYLGDLLSRTGHRGDARDLLDSLLASNPENARAAAVLGSIEIRGSRFDAGLALLERAARLRPDDAPIQSAFGIALHDQAQRQWSPITSPDVFARARAVLTRAAALDPSVASAHLALGLAEQATGDFDRAVDSIGRAIALAPARKDYRVARARVLVRQRDYARAEAELRPLATRASPAVRAAALDLLGALASDTRAAGLSAEGTPPSRTVSTSGVPALRPLREGELQAVGRFTTVDCSATLPLYLVQTERGLLRLTGVLGGVQLITYQREAQRAVGCGAVPDEPRVRVAYRPAAGKPDATGVFPQADSHGTAVAIEFIPDWFTPR
jgi:tetratricopeptide (TPR) repeat protein